MLRHNNSGRLHSTRHESEPQCREKNLVEYPFSYLPKSEKIRNMASMKSSKNTTISIAESIISEIKNNPDLAACKNFEELCYHCSSNTPGCSEQLVELVRLENPHLVLDAVQREVNLWLVANSIECYPHWDAIDMNVESHSAAFKVRHGRQANWDKEEEVCDQLWFDEIYLKIRALVKERTGR
jgi:hypothetical protein